ncbi:MAG: hypothetical protein OQJ77_04195 [Thiovulaceae bacterium]|nr:hypothetical protein [Sulfurimonadaceae bacterium]
MLLLKKLDFKNLLRTFICALLFSVYQTSFSKENTVAEATVVWSGGADLVVPFFIPPQLETKAGNLVYINVITANIGNIDAEPSTTRFYISANEVINQTEDHVLGKYSVKKLAAEEFLENKQFVFTIPENFSEGKYFLAACADAENVIAELNEDNNCSYSKLDNINSVAVPLYTNPNNPPNCEAAHTNINSIWPPNHKLVDITLAGVTDPDGDAISVEVVSIYQDEAVNELGDGNSEPDGYGIGTNIAKIRAERSGLGNGRVYSITFKASDDKGLSCSTVITVGVPHDKKDIAVLDNDKNFDSALVQ